MYKDDIHIDYFYSYLYTALLLFYKFFFDEVILISGLCITEIIKLCAVII